MKGLQEVLWEDIIEPNFLVGRKMKDTISQKFLSFLWASLKHKLEKDHLFIPLKNEGDIDYYGFFRLMEKEGKLFTTLNNPDNPNLSKMVLPEFQYPFIFSEVNKNLPSINGSIPFTLRQFLLNSGYLMQSNEWAGKKLSTLSTSLSYCAKNVWKKSVGMNSAPIEYILKAKGEAQQQRWERTKLIATQKLQFFSLVFPHIVLNGVKKYLDYYAVKELKNFEKRKAYSRSFNMFREKYIKSPEKFAVKDEEELKQLFQSYSDKKINFYQTLSKMRRSYPKKINGIDFYEVFKKEELEILETAVSSRIFLIEQNNLETEPNFVVSEYSIAIKTIDDFSFSIKLNWDAPAWLMKKRYKQSLKECFNQILSKQWDIAQFIEKDWIRKIDNYRPRETINFSRGLVLTSLIEDFVENATEDELKEAIENEFLYTELNQHFCKSFFDKSDTELFEASSIRHFAPQLQFKFLLEQKEKSLKPAFPEKFIEQKLYNLEAYSLLKGLLKLVRAGAVPEITINSLLEFHNLLVDIPILKEKIKVILNKALENKDYILELEELLDTFIEFKTEKLDEEEFSDISEAVDWSIKKEKLSSRIESLTGCPNTLFDSQYFVYQLSNIAVNENIKDIFRGYTLSFNLSKYQKYSRILNYPSSSFLNAIRFLQIDLSTIEKLFEKLENIEFLGKKLKPIDLLNPALFFANYKEEILSKSNEVFDQKKYGQIYAKNPHKKIRLWYENDNFLQFIASDNFQRFYVEVIKTLLSAEDSKKIQSVLNVWLVSLAETAQFYMLFSECNRLRLSTSRYKINSHIQDRFVKFHQKLSKSVR